MEEKDVDIEFFRKFDGAKKIFSDVFRQAKKEIILQDRDEFIEYMADHLMEDYNFTGDDADTYASLIYQIWEERCGCSVTSFDQEISSLKKKIFAPPSS